MITNKVNYFVCYLPKSRNVITLVRRINFAYNTILVSGSESSHSRVILKAMAALDTISLTSRPEALLNIAK